MAEVPLEKLRAWWHELAKKEIELEQRIKPLVDEHQSVHGKRMALENLMAQGQAAAITQQLSSEWEKLRKGEQLLPTERKPSDVAYDVLSRDGKPMHYRTILEESKKEGVAIGGRDPGTTLLAYMGRDERFIKARERGRGYWKLKRWEEKAE